MMGRTVMIIVVATTISTCAVQGWSSSCHKLVRRVGHAPRELAMPPPQCGRQGRHLFSMSASARGRPLLHPATIATQTTGAGRDEQYDGVAPAIYPASTYLRDVDLSYPKGKCYSRADNPTVTPAEDTLCSLEHGKDALLFASGMAAATTVFQAALVSGDRVVIPRVMYWALRSWIHTFCAQWGIHVTEVDMAAKGTGDEDSDGDYAELDAALAHPRTKIVWVETPANPTWIVTDIAAVAARARAAGALCVVDSTTASPVLTQPLTLGAHIVMHSATKYLNGHSDLVAGALVASVDMAAGESTAPIWAKVRSLRAGNGAILGAMDAWLLQRGMRTLYLRVGQQCASAHAIAKHFEANPAIDVLYPGLESFPGHAVARRQMANGFGGMLSLRVKGGREAAIAFAARCHVFHRATSLGGVESLIEHRSSIEGASSPVPGDLLRLSVGIEHVSDLIADLQQAADSLQKD